MRIAIGNAQNSQPVGSAPLKVLFGGATAISVGKERN